MILKQILKDWGLETLILSFFVLVIIPYGPGITFDSVSFFQAGDHFWSEGRYVHWGATGDFEFAAHRFPLYPLIVGAIYQSAQTLLLLQIILFAAFLLAFRMWLKQMKAPKYFLLLLVTLPVFLSYYCLWTESLYGVLFVLLLIQLKKEEEFQWVGWIVFLVVLLCLSRMVGVVVAGSLLVAYIVDKRALRGLVFFLVGGIVIVAWTLLGSYYLGETARSFNITPLSASDGWYLFEEFGRWLAVSSVNWIPFVIGLCLFLFPLVLIIRTWKERQQMGVLFWFLNIHFYGYVFFVVACKVGLDASIAFDARTLFPLIINFLALLVMTQTTVVFSDRLREKIRYIFPKVALLVVILNAHSLWTLMNSGVGYNSKDWKSFAFTKVLKDFQSDLIYTNDQAALFCYAPAIEYPHLLPEKMNLYSREQQKTYEAEMDLMLMDLANSPDGRIIWIRNGITSDVYPSYDELKANKQLELLYDDWLCLILQYKAK